MKRILFILLLLPAFVEAQIITTIAGGGSTLGDGGPATAANLNVFPAIAFDGTGNLYIGCNNAQRVRKVDATTGIITTVAGTGVLGYSGDGGPATAAKVYYPNNIAIDRHNNLFISDHTNRIRKVDAITGIITTIGGNGTMGFSGDGGPATAASINAPEGIAFDSIGNLYFGDYSNHRVRKIDTAGVISTVVGNGTIGYTGDGGPATAAGFAGVWGLCFDKFDNLYLADLPNLRVRKVTMSTGIITTVVGNGSAGSSGDGGPALSAGIDPWYIVFDAKNNMYISDSNRIRMVDSNMIIHTIAGNSVAGFIGDGGPATAAEFNQPGQLVLDSCGSLYIADAQNKRVRKITYPPILTIPTISLSGITTSAVGASVTITATITNAGSSYLIHWMNHNIQFATTTVPSVTYTKPAGFDTITARVVSTATYACYDSTTSAGHVVYVESGVNNVTTKGTFTVYPNPANSVLNITGSNITSVTINNLLGQTVYTHEYNSSQVQVNVADLPKGMYLVRINGSEVRKFIKE